MFRLIRTWIAALLATIALVASAASGILITTAIVFQQSIVSIAPQTGGLLSMSSWSDLAAEMRQMQESTATQRGELIQVEERLGTIEAARFAAREEFNALIDEVTRRGLAPRASDEAVALQELNAAITRDPAGTREIRPLVQRAGETRARLQSLEAERSTLEARQTELGTMLRAAEADVYSHVDSTLGPGVRENFDSIDAQIRSLQYLSRLGLGPQLVTIHPAFLTTVLAIQMGILGAMVLALPGFFAGQGSSMIGILARVVFGLVGGLVGYILLNIFLTSSLTNADGLAILRVAPSVVGAVAFLFGAFSFDLVLWARDSITRRFGRVRT